MEISKSKNLIGQLLLLIATILWGTSYFILKETIAEVPTFFVLTLRFFTSGVILFLVFYKKTFKMSKGTFLRGLTLGLFLSGAYITQTYGLSLTTPSRNAFVTAAYVIMVPFMVWAIYKTRPKNYNIISAVMCLLGIGFVSFSSGFGKSESTALIGDGFTFISAIFYALQIFFINKYQNENDDPMQLLSIELLTVGVVCGIITACYEVPVHYANGTLSVFALNTEQLLKIGYLALICTLLAQMFQMLGQRFTTANQASLILSLEAVFGTFFSVVLGDEKLTLMMIIGFSIVFISILINELKIDFVKLFNGKKSLTDAERKTNSNN